MRVGPWAWARPALAGVAVLDTAVIEPSPDREPIKHAWEGGGYLTRAQCPAGGDVRCPLIRGEVRPWIARDRDERLVHAALLSE